MSKSVLILAEASPSLGTGHLRRMQALVPTLEARGLAVSFEGGAADIVILDKRDAAFPTPARGSALFAIDNRGEGRKQADYVWDTLPHPAMGQRELKYSLQNVLLHGEVRRRPNSCERSSLCFASGHRSELSYQWRPTQQREKVSHSHHLRRLIHCSSLRTYFGQTMFEGLYLGKDVELYSISPYHRRLAEWFIDSWNGLSTPGLYFDGKGLERLADRIASL